MRFFPPVVTGPIIIAIGLILAPGASQRATNWLLAIVALAAVIVCNIWGKGMVKILPILIGLIVSYLVALVTNAVNFDAIGQADWFGCPCTPARWPFATAAPFVPPSSPSCPSLSPP